MSSIRLKRKAETRSLLLEAGLKVFADRGFDSATLDDVARAAGFTKGAIYRQFPSKGAFLLGLFEQYAAVARAGAGARRASWFVPLTIRSEEHTSELQSLAYLVCRLLLEKKKKYTRISS